MRENLNNLLKIESEVQKIIHLNVILSLAFTRIMCPLLFSSKVYITNTLLFSNSYFSIFEIDSFRFIRVIWRYISNLSANCNYFRYKFSCARNVEKIKLSQYYILVHLVECICSFPYHSSHLRLSTLSNDYLLVRG